MPNYRIREPQPRPVVHEVEFSRDEVMDALVDYAAKHDIVVPDGVQTIWGLEQEDHMRENTVTLVVEEEMTKDE